MIFRLGNFVVNRPSDFLRSSRARASFFNMRCLDFCFLSATVVH